MLKRVSICLCLSLGFLCFLSFPVLSATYYVSPTGSDANTGTTESFAWQTIRYAVTKVSSGDDINVLGGTYTSTYESPIVIPGGVTIAGESSTLTKVYGPGTGNAV